MSNTTVVRYRPRADQADENQRLVEAVFAELEQTHPTGFSYTTWRLADDTFVHVAEFEGDSNPLTQVAAFRAFTREIDARCEPSDRPLAQPAVVVGRYDGN